MSKKSRCLSNEELKIYWELLDNFEPRQWAFIACLLRIPYPLDRGAKMKAMDMLFNIVG